MSRALETIRERIEYLKEDIRKSYEAAAKWSMYEFDEDANPCYNDISADKYEIERLEKLESQILEDEKETAELKRVLEIIKEKDVNIASLKAYDLEEYNMIYEDKLTKEEFELLKKWLSERM